MPATLLTETQWHGNPRGTPSYAWTVHEGDVASPYYSDGRQVPVIKAAVTDAPFQGYPETANTASTVTFSGTFYRGVGVQVQIETDQGEESTPIQAFYTEVAPGVHTPTEFAAQFAAFFNQQYGALVLATPSAGVVSFAAAGATTALNVISTTVVLP